MADIGKMLNIGADNQSTPSVRVPVRVRVCVQECLTVVSELFSVSGFVKEYSPAGY